MGIVASSLDASMQSYLRFLNTGASAGTVDVAIAELSTGKVLATWTSPPIAVGTATQFAIGTIEKAATAAFPAPGVRDQTALTAAG